MARQNGYQPLGRSEIRRRLLNGELRQSQLIWNPKDQAWREARAMPELTSQPEAPPSSKQTQFFVAPPTGGEYQPLARNEIRKRLREGSLRDSHLIWNPTEKVWKELRAAPEFKDDLAVQGPSEEGASRSLKLPVFKAASTVPGKGKPRPKVRLKPKSGPVSAQDASAQTDVLKEGIPQSGQNRVRKVKLRAKLSKEMDSSTYLAMYGDREARLPRSETVGIVYQQERRSRYRYGLAFILVIATIAVGNWFTLTRPVAEAIRHSEFAGRVRVGAHYRFYLRPGSVVLNFDGLPKDLTTEQFVSLLSVLAGGSGRQALTGEPFDEVHLVKEGTTRYVFRGIFWQQLAAASDLSIPEKAMLITNNLFLPNGKPALMEQDDNAMKRHDQKLAVFQEFQKAFVSGL